MKALPHLYAKLFSSPLMLHEPVRRSFEAHILAHMEAGTPTPQAGPREDMQRQRVANIYERIGNVAVMLAAVGVSATGSGWPAAS